MATGIGETLRDARLQRDLSLEDAAAETRIRASYLAALEQEEFTRLGGDVYVRGFIRSYAKLLGVDPAPLLHEYGGSPTEPRATTEPPMSLGSEPLERGPRRGVGIAVAAVALVTIVGLAVTGGNGPEEVDLDDDPLAEEGSDADPEEAEPDEREPDPAGGTEPATPPPTGSGDTGQGDGADQTATDGLAVLLEVTQRDAWVRVLVDGDEVFQGTLEPGASETFEGDDEVRLRIGDPAAVELTVNGDSLGNPGDPGQPVWVTVDADGDVVIG